MFAVSYLRGERVIQTIMTQKELDECRSRYEIVEALAV